MPHVVLIATEQVVVQPGSVVSKVVHRDDSLNVTVFGLAAGEGLSERPEPAGPRWSRSCRDGCGSPPTARNLDLGPGSWLHMSPGTPHALKAPEPTVMLLTLLGP